MTEALVFSAEGDAVEPLPANPMSGGLAVDILVERVEAHPPVERFDGLAVLVRRGRSRVGDPRPRDGNPLVARPCEHVVDVRAGDVESFADVILVEVGREVALQPALEELVDVEGPRGPARAVSV